MPINMPSSLMPKTSRNTVIRQSEWNQVVRMAREDKFFSTGVSDIGGVGAYDYNTAEPFVFPVISDAYIPQYSIFCLVAPSGFSSWSPLEIAVEAANDNNQKIYLTNGESIGGNNDYGGASKYACQAQIIQQFKPVLLKIYEGAGAVAINVNRDCGPKKTTFEIDGNSTGLICLAKDPDNKYAWCVATQAGKRWLCKPTGSDIAANGGTGTVNIWGGVPGAEVALSPAQTFTGVCNRTAAALKVNKWCEMLDIEGKLYAVPWEC